ncbi:MAG TPA: hypothetical protein VJ841_03735 [Candidatus Saccharimonadales bacterium]|nr:hypothetical protein [Candidatus Saccharimonadales bacterium]
MSTYKRKKIQIVLGVLLTGSGVFMGWYSIGMIRYSIFITIFGTLASVLMIVVGVRMVSGDKIATILEDLFSMF